MAGRQETEKQSKSCDCKSKLVGRGIYTDTKSPTACVWIQKPTTRTGLLLGNSSVKGGNLAASAKSFFRWPVLVTETAVRSCWGRKVHSGSKFCLIILEDNVKNWMDFYFLIRVYKVVFHLSDPTSQFLNGTNEFSELILATISSVLPLQSAKTRGFGELWREKCTRAPWTFPF